MDGCVDRWEDSITIVIHLMFLIRFMEGLPWPQLVLPGAMVLHILYHYNYLYGYRVRIQILIIVGNKPDIILINLNGSNQFQFTDPNYKYLKLKMAQKGMPLNKALALWEQKNGGKPASEAEEIKLIFQHPPIDKLQTSILSTLTRVQKLSLSSNSIDKMVNMPPLKSLTRLSLARNNIKRISGLEEVAGTLKQLWLSYNQIEKLDGLSMCSVLQTLFIGNNRIKNWDQLDKLRQLPEFSNTLLVGNPFYEILKEDAKYYALKKIPQLKNIDGSIVEAKFQAKADELPDNFPPPVK